MSQLDDKYELVKEKNTNLNLNTNEDHKRNLRQRKINENKYKDFLTKEEEIFGDVLEDNVPIYELKNKKRKKKTRDEIAQENQKLTDKFIISENDNTAKKSNKVKDKADIAFIKKTSKVGSKQMKDTKLIQSEDIKVETNGNDALPVNYDEIDNLVVEIKEKASGKRKKPEILVEPENLLDSALDKVIDLNELNDKSRITNSDMILAIIEICIHAMQYDIKYSNSTRLFWEEVYNKKDWTNILKNFKAETLRKYWRVLRDVGNIKKLIETVKNYSASINDEEFK